MADNRETHNAGSPVEEAAASETDVLAAVERAQDPVGNTSESDASSTDADAETTKLNGEGVEEEPLTLPEEKYSTVGLATEPHIETPEIDLPERLPAVDEEPMTSTYVAPTPGQDAARDGEIRISADHPMAALYMQTPMPPEMRGNRGAGVLISLLATIVFALVYAGVIALRLALDYPPSTFVSEGLVPFVTSWGFIAATASFFVGLVLLVLIFGRAGWWAYVLGGFVVAAGVWGVSVVGYAFDPEVMGLSRDSWNPEALARTFGLTVPTLGAALVAREVIIWFGAWIGSRGRKIAAKNAVALADYEKALEEVRQKQA